MTKSRDNSYCMWLSNLMFVVGSMVFAGASRGAGITRTGTVHYSTTPHRGSSPAHYLRSVAKASPLRIHTSRSFTRQRVQKYIANHTFKGGHVGQEYGP
jgi:hypothetical protein